MIVRIQTLEKLKNNPEVQNFNEGNINPITERFWTQDRIFMGCIIKIRDTPSVNGIHHCLDGMGCGRDSGNVFLCTVEEFLNE